MLRRILHTIAWLMGIRTLKEVDTPDEHYTIMRFPSWMKDEGVRDRVARIESDARLAGKPVNITVGHRVIRIDYLS